MLFRSKKSQSEIDPNIPLLLISTYALNSSQLNTAHNIWEEIGYRRSQITFSFTIDQFEKTINLISSNGKFYQFEIEGSKIDVILNEIKKNFISLNINSINYEAYLSVDKKGVYYATVNGNSFQYKRNDFLDDTEISASSTSGDDGSNLFAPMPGKVIKINVKEGEKVKRGTVLLVVEAMKMENNIVAVHDAIVEKLNVSEEEMVDTDKQLVQLSTNI